MIDNQVSLNLSRLSTSDLVQPYRTTPLVLPHAKTIHDLGDQGNKFVTPSRQPDTSCPVRESSSAGSSLICCQPYRTSSLVMPGPRTIHEVKAGGPSFKPYRGPQYYADKGFSPLPLPTITQHSPDTNSLTHFQPLQTYNSPVNLYSDQALAEALHNKPVAVTTEGVAKPSARYQVGQARRYSELKTFYLSSQPGLELGRPTLIKVHPLRR